MIGAELTMTASVLPGPDRAAVLSVTVDDGLVPQRLAATVSRTAADRWQGESIRYGVRVVLDGSDVSADLVGPVTRRATRDNPLRTATFAVAGRRYSPLVTATTWTRTPVEIWLRQGSPGDVAETLGLRGYVAGCKAQGESATGPVYEIEVGDGVLPYLRTRICLTIPPLGSYRRGQICAQAAAGAGITKIDVPPGAVYRKAVHTDQPVFDFLRDFAGPEGWSWRMRPDGTLEAYSAEVRPAPAAPDHVRTLADLLAAPTVVPPEDVPSRWIVRGAATVYGHDPAGGLRTEVEEAEVVASYAPVPAVARQELDGSRTEIDYDWVAADRVVSRVRSERVYRGEVPVRTTTTEWGWYNPEAAPLSTSRGINLGDYPLEVRIDASDRYVTWRSERFVRTSKRVETPQYDADGNQTGVRSEHHRWYRRSQAVRSASYDPTPPNEPYNVHDTLLGADGGSWAALGVGGQIDVWGLAEVGETTHEYGAAGAVTREIEETWGWYSPAASVDPTGPYWVVARGTGQVDLRAPWGRTRRLTRLTRLDRSGRISSQAEIEEGWSAPAIVGGEHDYGDRRSNADSEDFRIIGREDRSYEVHGFGSFEEVSAAADGAVDREIRSGTPPLPRYQESAWTRVVQDPIEIIWEDPTLKEWYGFAVLVLSSEYVQSHDEARAWLLAELRRRLAREYTLVGPETPAEVGETVRLIDPSQGIDVRAVITETEKTRDPASGRAVERLVLEEPLL